MIRKSLIGIAASFMTLAAFGGTLGVLQVGTGPAVAAVPVA